MAAGGLQVKGHGQHNLTPSYDTPEAAGDVTQGRPQLTGNKDGEEEGDYRHYNKAQQGDH